MGAGLRTESKDQSDQRAARRQRIGQQCQAGIPATQSLGHDAGAHHRDQQQQGSGKFHHGGVQYRSLGRAMLRDDVHRHDAGSVAVSVRKRPISLTFC